jgi:hypothetical protein
MEGQQPRKPEPIYLAGSSCCSRTPTGRRVRYQFDIALFP